MFKQKQKLKNVKFTNKNFRKILILRNKPVKNLLYRFSKKEIDISTFSRIIKLLFIFILLYLLLTLKKYLRNKKIFFCFCGTARYEKNICKRISVILFKYRHWEIYFWR